jgi:hypothetical protein
MDLHKHQCEKVVFRDVVSCLVRRCRRLLLVVVYCADQALSSLAWWRKIVNANDMQAVAEGAQP